MGRWIGFSVFLYIVGLIFGGIPIGVSLLENATAVAPINSIMGYQVAYAQQSWGQQIYSLFHLDFFQAIFKIMTLDLPIFGGPTDPAQIMRWIFLAPIIATIGFELIVTMVSLFRFLLS